MLEELYLVRHAEPDRGIQIAYNVHPGPPLTARGHQEAQQAAVWLAERGIEYLFASPFERASQTADMIVDRLKLPFSYAQALRESGPNETMDQVSARVAELLTQVDDGPLCRVAFVSHGAPILALLRHTTEGRIDLSRHMYDRGNNTPTAGVWHGVRGERCWRWELAFRPVAQVL